MHENEDDAVELFADINPRHATPICTVALPPSFDLILFFFASPPKGVIAGAAGIGKFEAEFFRRLEFCDLSRHTQRLSGLLVVLNSQSLYVSQNIFFGSLNDWSLNDRPKE